MKVSNWSPSTAIVIPLMDRADDLRKSLPNLLSQNYPNYKVYIVDHSSQDGLEAVLQEIRHPKLRFIQAPRFAYFNFSRSRNIGARYTFSDLLFFLNGDNQFQHPGQLSEIVNDFLKGTKVPWYKRLRGALGDKLLKNRVSLRTPYPRVYCHCLGSPLFIAREVFQQLGGYNEDFEDWGYEDTDLRVRLALAGFDHIPIAEMIQPEHPDELRLKNFREKDKNKSWHRNRRLSDELIESSGPVIRTRRYPGRCEWMEIDGLRRDGVTAAQQNWEMRLSDSIYDHYVRPAATKLLTYVRHVPPPSAVKVRVVKEYARRFPVKTFIETGTCQGNMINVALRACSFTAVHSIELDQALYEAAKLKFAPFKNVFIHQGDSGEVLGRILSDIHEPALFWLDAHYSDGVTARGELETPIVQELEHVLNHPVKSHVILIDDARDFIGQNDYPSIEQLRSLIAGKRPEWDLKVRDGIIRIVPYPRKVKF